MMLKTIQLLLLTVLAGCQYGQMSRPANEIFLPSLTINDEGNHPVVKAYRLALGDVFSNVQDHYIPLLGQKKSCLYAGFEYVEPWTRDAAINVWNGFALLSPSIALNTLLAQLDTLDDERIVITHEYWDKIIWSIGAWHYYLATGNQDFLGLAYTAVSNTLAIMEDTEYSSALGLFRGPAVYGDGVSAYPAIYTKHADTSLTGSYSGISDWPVFNPSLKANTGKGIPMHVLSTNSVYYYTYKLMPQYEQALGIGVDPSWHKKAAALKHSINKHLWDEGRGMYHYFVDPFGGCDHQEGMGLSLAILLGVAESSQVQSIFNNTTITPAGIPCVYPSYERYHNAALDSYGRHSGTVWPHIQGLWAEACIQNGYSEGFFHEFEVLTQHALRDNQFYELYHPATGMPYGGIQEPTHKIWEEWYCGARQTWSATAYIRMLLFNIIGMDLSPDGLKFKPNIPSYMASLELTNLVYRNMVLDIRIQGNGDEILSLVINEADSDSFLKSHLRGHQRIRIEMKNN